jgi:hypothetical protein
VQVALNQKGSLAVVKLEEAVALVTGGNSGIGLGRQSATGLTRL